MIGVNNGLLAIFVINQSSMSISNSELYISLAIALVLGGSLAYLFWKQRKEMKNHMNKKEKETASAPSTSTIQLQLNAYERLILLADRIALPNLINRMNQSGIGLKDMQLLLTQTIRQEFDHNITQQIYVSAEAWEAVRNLKDQNLLIINQIASFLPAEASGADLNKSILEMLLQNPKASLHHVVSEVLGFEARKLMK
jgi:hypothetical protein